MRASCFELLRRRLLGGRPDRWANAGPPRRYLHLHEYQSMEMMRQFGVSVPRFAAAASAEGAMRAAGESIITGAGGKCDYVVKAQVLAGGRGLGHFKENGFRGGVHICDSVGQVGEVAGKMLGNTLVTKQTGAEGKKCGKVLVAERFYIRSERYLAILMDRSAGDRLLLGSAVGGTSIEDIAERHPEAIVKQPVDIAKGLSDEEVARFVKRLGFSDSDGPTKKAKQAAECVKGLYRMFIEKDCLLVEVNPFAETHDGRVLVCDAKVNFDDNAEFRQPQTFAQEDESQVDPREVEAARSNLNYVGLHGNIGCMVNGAGLAMATMDIIQLQGGAPANFLDVGGGAENEQIVDALRILENDKAVSVILINIFGGIMKCDTIANGLITAGKRIGLSKPLVVRLEGTNRSEARRLLGGSGLKFTFENDLAAAATKAVQMAGIVDLARKAGVEISFQPTV